MTGRGWASALAGLLLLGLLGGCTGTGAPRPFQPDAKGDNALLLLPDRTGITVAPVTGDVPDGGLGLAESMAEALRTQNVPASVASGNSETRWLLGEVRETGATADGRARLGVTWELYGPGGEPIGRATQQVTVPAAAWRAGEPAALDKLARAAAPRIADLIQEPRGRRVALPGYPEGTRLVVAPIAGRPGAATRALAQAMVAELRRRDLPLADRARPGDVVIDGQFTLGESNGTARPLELIWIVRRKGADGRLGDLRQANQVPLSAIQDGWDRLARLITRAAAPSVLQVLQAKAPGG